MTVELFVLGVIVGIGSGLLNQHFKSKNKSNTEKSKLDMYKYEMQIRKLNLRINDLEYSIYRLDELQKPYDNLVAAVDDEERSVAYYYTQDRKVMKGTIQNEDKTNIS